MLQPAQLGTISHGSARRALPVSDLSLSLRVSVPASRRTPRPHPTRHIPASLGEQKSPPPPDAPTLAPPKHVLPSLPNSSPPFKATPNFPSALLASAQTARF